MAFVAAMRAAVVVVVPENTWAETIAARPAGAAWTELAEMAAAMAALEVVTPRCAKNFRIFSTARCTRLCAAASVVRMAVAISARGLPLK